LTRLQRIALLIASTVAILAFSAFWIAPVWLSFNTARTAAESARLVPVDLPDRSISPTPGSTLSYLGTSLRSLGLISTTRRRSAIQIR
jgi:hypothetical protein